jgi:hypothetical protein
MEFYFVHSNDNGFEVIGKVFSVTDGEGEALQKGIEMVKGLNLKHWDVSGGYDHELHAHQAIRNYKESVNEKLVWSL